MPDKPRCVILSQLFYPEEAATGRLMTDLAEAMVRHGMEVSAVAGQPTYFHYGKAPADMTHNGVHIHRPPCTWFRKDSLPGRLLNVLTLFVGAVLHLLFTREKGPLLIVTNPPFLPLIGYLCKKMHGARYVVLVHDVYPDLLPLFGLCGPGSIIVRLWNRLNRLIYGNADGVVVLGRKMAEIIARKDPRCDAESRIHRIPNWSDGELIRPKPKEQSSFFQQSGVRAGTVLQYSGNIGRQHNVEMLVEAMERLKDRDVHLMFVGDGYKRPVAERMVRRKGLDNVSFHPFQPREMLGESLTGCDVQVAVLAGEMTGLAVPCKLYGMLACGKPIIVVCDPAGEMGRVVLEEQCGRVVRPDDPDGLLAAIEELASDAELRRRMGARAREAFEGRYTLDHVADQYVELMRTVQS